MAAPIIYRTTSTPVLPSAPVVKGTPFDNTVIDSNMKALSDEIEKKYEEALLMAMVLG